MIARLEELVLLGDTGTLYLIFAAQLEDSTQKLNRVSEYFWDLASCEDDENTASSGIEHSTEK